MAQQFVFSFVIKQNLSSFLMYYWNCTSFSRSSCNIFLMLSIHFFFQAFIKINKVHCKYFFIIIFNGKRLSKCFGKKKKKNYLVNGKFPYSEQ